MTALSISNRPSATERQTMALGSDNGVDDTVSRRIVRTAERRRGRVITIISLVAGSAATVAAITFAQMLVTIR